MTSALLMSEDDQEMRPTDFVRNDELFMVEKDFKETFEAVGLDERNCNKKSKQACHKMYAKITVNQAKIMHLIHQGLRL